MTPEEHSDELLDLVRTVLYRRAEKVDVDAFAARLDRRRRPRRLALWLVPAAAAALVAAVVLLGDGASAPAPRPSKPVLLALNECTDALRRELSAAAGGARVVGSAAASATRAPLRELTGTRVPVPDLGALNDLLPAETDTHIPNSEENTP
jgi:hypothetical protein